MTKIKRSDIGISQRRVNAIIALQRENDIIAMLLDGKESREISKWLINRYSIAQGTANIYIGHARDIIKKRKAYEVNNLVSLHIYRYEELFKLLKEIGADHLAIRALAQKEKLLGFHREGFHMKVTSGEITSIQLQTVDSDYNVKKLTQDKQDRLTELLNKAKRDGRDRSIPVNGGSDQGVRKS
jgi:hypothetical protein